MVKKKIKILFLIGSINTGGKERQLLEIAKNLPIAQYELFLFSKSIASTFITKDNLEVLFKAYFTTNRKKFILRDIFILAKLIKHHKPHVVFSFSTTLSHFALLVKKTTFHKFKLINGSIRSAQIDLSYLDFVEKYLYSFYRNVVSNSVAGLKTFNQYKRNGRYLLYNGFSEKRTTNLNKLEAIKKLGFNVKKFNVLMVSSLRICYSKDPITFLKVAKYLQNKDKDIFFYLAGDGEMREELNNYVKNNCISNIKILGQRKDVELLFKAADISVLTSKDEGISNSILESMACGTPVIATSKGGTNEIINNNFNGYILNHKDYVSVSNKIIHLKNNKNIIQSFSKRAETLVKEKFSIELMIKNFQEIIEKSRN